MKGCVVLVVVVEVRVMVWLVEEIIGVDLGCCVDVV